MRVIVSLLRIFKYACPSLYTTYLFRIPNQELSENILRIYALQFVSKHPQGQPVPHRRMPGMEYLSQTSEIFGCYSYFVFFTSFKYPFVLKDYSIINEMILTIYLAFPL